MQKTHTFDLDVYGKEVRFCAVLDHINDKVVREIEPVNPDDKGLMRMFFKARRTERGTKLPRQHDMRMVSSEIDWQDGRMKMVVELGDVFIPFDQLVKAAADIAVDLGIISIAASDPTVMQHAIDLCSY